jgi:CHAT domain/SIR2-like domain
VSRVPDIEFAIHPRDSFGYPIVVRYLPADSEEIHYCAATIPWEGFAPPKSDDKQASGVHLGEILFSENVRDAYVKARTDAENLQSSLRFRLLIGAPDLYNICWETLRAPGCESPLARDEHIMFSRFLSSSWWRHVKIRSKATLRALVLIANPEELSTQEAFKLIDVESQLDCAKRCIGSHFEIKELVNREATAKNLINYLREDFDLLYLVCHGSVAEDDTRLLLDDGTGHIDWVAGHKISDAITGMVNTPPRLALLAPCHSGGTGVWQRNAVRTLGPQLAKAGIPAVVGMQGNVAQETISKFFPALFDALQDTGEIDRAVTVARRTLSEDDWWMPVLYMRFKSGRVWYEAEFDKTDFIAWPEIVRMGVSGCCMPILGPDLPERLLGSRRDIASRWAQSLHFPLEAHRQEDLAQVAQYVGSLVERKHIPKKLFEHFRARLLDRFEKELPDDLLRQVSGAAIRGTDVAEEARIVDELIRAVGKLYRNKNPRDPYRLLAQLEFPVYVTTEPTSLLEDAISEEGNAAYTEICRWNSRIQSPSVTKQNPDYSPTPERPLVYHLFGHLRDVASLVLTEDDYFDFLIGKTEADIIDSNEKNSMSQLIYKVLNNCSVLYIGFELGGRDFRVMSRVLKQISRGEAYGGVAAQIDPEEDRTLDPDRARRYMERIFLKSEKFDIYWGTPQDFVGRLFDDVKDATKAIEEHGEWKP